MSAIPAGTRRRRWPQRAGQAAAGGVQAQEGARPPAQPAAVRVKGGSGPPVMSPSQPGPSERFCGDFENDSPVRPRFLKPSVAPCHPQDEGHALTSSPVTPRYVRAPVSPRMKAPQRQGLRPGSSGPRAQNRPSHLQCLTCFLKEQMHSRGRVTVPRGRPVPLSSGSRGGEGPSPAVLVSEGREGLKGAGCTEHAP